MDMLTYTFDRLTEYDARRSCLDKRTFDCKNEARDYASRVRKNLGKDQAPYKCLVCHLWHLTACDPATKNIVKDKLRNRAST